MNKFPLGDLDKEKLRWLDDAACAEMGIEDFFVEAGRGITEDALSVCRSCPVRRDCLQHAYSRDIHGGYFGGVSPGRRRRMSESEALAFVERDKPRTRHRDTPSAG